METEDRNTYMEYILEWKSMKMSSDLIRFHLLGACTLHYAIVIMQAVSGTVVVTNLYRCPYKIFKTVSPRCVYFCDYLLFTMIIWSKFILNLVYTWAMHLPNPCLNHKPSFLLLNPKTRNVNNATHAQWVANDSAIND